MQLIQKIQKRLESPLPGINAQYKMAPMGRVDQVNDVNFYTPAGVLCFLYPGHSDWEMVFIQRANHKLDKHSAQIAFPGGKMEVNDKNLIHTALREAEEEVGLPQNDVKILGELTPLPIPVSKYRIHPVMGFGETKPQFIPQLSEVQNIIEIPLGQILDPTFQATKKITLSSGFQLENVPVFQFEHYTIWGATAMVLSEIIHILK